MWWLLTFYVPLSLLAEPHMEASLGTGIGQSIPISSSFIRGLASTLEVGTLGLSPTRPLEKPQMHKAWCS